jgi:hypothetical protein
LVGKGGSETTGADRLRDSVQYLWGTMSQAMRQ